MNRSSDSAKGANDSSLYSGKLPYTARPLIGTRDKPSKVSNHQKSTGSSIGNKGRKMPKPVNSGIIVPAPIKSKSISADTSFDSSSPNLSSTQSNSLAQGITSGDIRNGIDGAIKSAAPRKVWGDGTREFLIKSNNPGETSNERTIVIGEQSNSKACNSESINRNECGTGCSQDIRQHRNIKDVYKTISDEDKPNHNTSTANDISQLNEEDKIKMMSQQEEAELQAYQRELQLKRKDDEKFRQMEVEMVVRRDDPELGGARIVVNDVPMAQNVHIIGSVEDSTLIVGSNHPISKSDIHSRHSSMEESYIPPAQRKLRRRPAGDDSFYDSTIPTDVRKSSNYQSERSRTDDYTRRDRGYDSSFDRHSDDRTESRRSRTDNSNRDSRIPTGEAMCSRNDRSEQPSLLIRTETEEERRQRDEQLLRERQIYIRRSGSKSAKEGTIPKSGRNVSKSSDGAVINSSLPRGVLKANDNPLSSVKSLNTAYKPEEATLHGKKSGRKESKPSDMVASGQTSVRNDSKPMEESVTLSHTSQNATKSENLSRTKKIIQKGTKVNEVVTKNSNISENSKSDGIRSSSQNVVENVSEGLQLDAKETMILLEQLKVWGNHKVKEFDCITLSDGTYSFGVDLMNQASVEPTCDVVEKKEEENSVENQQALSTMQKPVGTLQSFASFGDGYSDGSSGVSPANAATASPGIFVPIAPPYVPTNYPQPAMYGNGSVPLMPTMYSKSNVIMVPQGNISQQNMMQAGGEYMYSYPIEYGNFLSWPAMGNAPTYGWGIQNGQSYNYGNNQLYNTYGTRSDVDNGYTYMQAAENSEDDHSGRR